MPSGAEKRRRKKIQREAEGAEASQTTKDQQESGVSELLEKITFSEERRSNFSVVSKPRVSGNSGRSIRLISNSYPISFNIEHLCHYDITITQLFPWRPSNERGISAEACGSLPTEDVEKVTESGKAIKSKYRCLNTKMNRIVIQKFVDENREMFSGNSYAFDGVKNMYTLRPLEINGNEFIIEVSDEMNRETQYDIKIQHAVNKDGSLGISLAQLSALLKGCTHSIPEDAVMAIETVIRHQPAKTHIPIGRSFFPNNPERYELPGGRIMKFGYHQSIVLTKGRANLNIDMTATTFFEPGAIVTFLVKLLKMIQQERKDGQRTRIETVRDIPNLSENQFERFRKEIIGVRIHVTHFEQNRKYVVHDVTKQSASNLYFELEEGRNINITDYFAEKYNIKLKCGHLPCLQVHKTKPIYMPLDVCEFPEGEHCRYKIGNLQTAKMIKESALPPIRRFQYIQKMVDNTIKEFRNYNKSFDINIQGTPVKLTGRVLDPPKMIYRSSNMTNATQPKYGEWKLDSKKFLEGRTLKYWSVVSLIKSDEVGYQLDQFIKKFREIGQKLGLTISPASEIQYCKRDTDICDLLRDLCNRNEMLEMVFVVLKSKNDGNYSKIKCCAETELGIITQCVSYENICKCDNQFISENILQKVNGKLGGNNTCIDPKEMPDLLNDFVMIIGADCNHPSPHDKVNSSIAAAVGSIDARMFRYANAWKIQPKVNNKRVEIIKNLKEMVKDLLKAYITERRKEPSRIIFYRDGVSEGEYLKTLQEEVPQVFDACKEIRNGYKPQLTFVIVTKRHHTKFQVENARDGIMPSGNIPPGTVVTTDVTHVLNFDYYLCSQKGLKGTSIPAHYTVVYDDNNFRSNPDALYKLSYCLCHVSSRCTKSISIPVPVAYADLLAYRIKQYLNAKGEGCKSADKIDIEDLEREISVSEKLSGCLFYI